MKNITFRLLTLCIVVMSFQTIYAQIGAFNVTNNTNCTYDAKAYSYDGSCASFTCTSADNTGWVSVPANSTTDIASGFSGTGDTWGRVEVSDGSYSTLDGDANCFSRIGFVCCGPNQYTVSWGGCHSANVP